MIEAVIRKLCDVGARAVSRYVEVSGMWPDDMPEYFMPGFIFDHLGDEITMTLETGFVKLLEWNAETLNRRGLARHPDGNRRCATPCHWRARATGDKCHVSRRLFDDTDC